MGEAHGVLELEAAPEAVDQHVKPADRMHLVDSVPEAFRRRVGQVEEQRRFGGLRREHARHLAPRHPLPLRLHRVRPQLQDAVRLVRRAGHQAVGGAAVVRRVGVARSEDGLVGADVLRQ